MNRATAATSMMQKRMMSIVFPILLFMVSESLIPAIESTVIQRHVKMDAMAIKTAGKLKYAIIIGAIHRVPIKNSVKTPIKSSFLAVLFLTKTATVVPPTIADTIATTPMKTIKITIPNKISIKSASIKRNTILYPHYNVG